MAPRVSYRCVSCDRVIRGLTTPERHIKQEHDGAGRYEQVGCIPEEGRDG